MNIHAFRLTCNVRSPSLVYVRMNMGTEVGRCLFFTSGLKVSLFTSININIVCLIIIVIIIYLSWGNKSRENGACFYLGFLLFDMRWVKYLIDILERVSINLCILLFRILSSMSFYMAVVWREP